MTGRKYLWRILALSGASLLLLASCTSCSPGYVLRASWEEANILMDRKPIDEVLDSDSTDEDLRKLLFEVRRSRNYAQEIGFNAGGSFSYYTKVDRDVLVWVVSAAPKNKLEFKTWWFPIVGSVPYKGFFEKDDGMAELKSLSEDGYDAVLRPSQAFSTLGWFDDPLLSTMTKTDINTLVDTVFHELLHNTIWLPNHVPFNESLANSVGAFSAIEYFSHYYSPAHQFTLEAKSRWKDEVRYGRFISQVCADLRAFYRQHEDKEIAEVVELRKEFFAKASERWEVERKNFTSERYRRQNFQTNNASLLAETIYLSNLHLFDGLYKKSGEDLQKYLALVRQVVENSKKLSSDPFVQVKELLNEDIDPK